MKVRPLSLAQAQAYITEHHRHHKRPQGHRFSLAAFDGDELIGVVVVGRPVARAVDQWRVAEVTRLCTNGRGNACSFLYGAAARVAKTMGFERIQTYILASEPGTSLKAAGWVCEGQLRRDGAGWNNRAGRRSDQPTEPKVRWSKALNL